MRAHQAHFEQLRNAELVATQRMEAAERRKVEEKERRVAQERARLRRERIVREKVAAATFARGFLTGVVDDAISRLWKSGHFYDPVERAVETEFLPWLRDAAAAAAERTTAARAAAAALVAGAVGRLEAQREANRATRRAQLARLAEVQVRGIQNWITTKSMVLDSSCLASLLQAEFAQLGGFWRCVGLLRVSFEARVLCQAQLPVSRAKHHTCSWRLRAKTM